MWVALMFIQIVQAIGGTTKMNGKNVTCDISECKVTVYQECPPSPQGCGSINGTSCKYLPFGLRTNSKCAWKPCPILTGNGTWQNICSGISAIETKGPCSTVLAEGSDGEQPFSRILMTGFHGLRGLNENGTQYWNNVRSVKLSCLDMPYNPLGTIDHAPAMLMNFIEFFEKDEKEDSENEEEKGSYTRKAGVVLSVGFLAFLGAGFI